MINLIRRKRHLFDKKMKKQLLDFHRPFRFVPCFLQGPVERINKRSKKTSVIIQFKQNCYESGLNDVKQAKCRKLREFPVISSCSARLSVKDIEKLANTCNHIHKIHHNRKVKALLDTATPAINADQSHDNERTGKNVTIAIVDTGVYPHKDLEGRITGFKDFVKNKTKTYDDNGHGTHCAGDAASDGTQSFGRYKAPAPEANIVGVKVLNKLGSGSLSTVIEGIHWCIQNKATKAIDILSLSLGTDASESAEDDPVVKAVEAAWDNGIVVVTAAGNEGPDEQTISSPGISPKVITVGAVDDHNTIDRSDDTIADFSSRGPTIDDVTKPDLLTPGADIVSLRAPDSYLDRTNKTARVGQYYFSLSGTSMATPICAGAAALLMQSNPKYTPDQIKEQLKDATTDMGQPPNAQGNGYLQL